MCTFLDDRKVMVCDVARDRVRSGLGAEFAGQVSFTHVEHEGTLVEAADGLEAERFRAAVQRLIDEQAAVDADTGGATP